MQFFQTHEAFRAAHHIARRYEGHPTPYQQRFNEALRGVFARISEPAAAVATRALSRSNRVRAQRSATIVVTSVNRRPDRLIGRVRNTETGTTYQTVLFLGSPDGGFFCTCPDHEFRGGVCKHGVALAEHVVREND